MLGLFKAWIFLFFVIGAGFIFSKIGSALIKKEGAAAVIWIIWLFLVFGIYLGGDFPDFDNYRPY